MTDQKFNSVSSDMTALQTYLEKTAQKKVVIVTGMSGAGKMSVMRTLEDFGFYCVDNLPVPLLSTFLDFSFKAHGANMKVAIGIDTRSRSFLKDCVQEVDRLRSIEKQHAFFECKIIFLTSSEQVIIKRFQETRRKHPLGRGISIKDAIRKEKELLKPLRDAADIILDTNTFNIHELRRWVRGSFTQENHEMLVNLVSFGFKYGIPTESNVLYDLRFLPNPYFIPALKSLDGRDKPIHTYLFEQPEIQEYWNRLSDFLHYSLQKSYDEGRFFITVALGCTGGHHRSVAFVERIAQQKWEHVRFLVHHRDIKKGT